QQLVGDRPKLNQILLNTIGNAVKFTDEGEVTVRVESIAVPVSDGVHLVFHVSDTGVGIPAEQQEAVFNAFYQVSDAAHSRPGGTGLGLAI
ncbi:ATP-binding protein, partial [Escherichia coli]|uniref:ATP-binding protein n=1 Tax=Escherichia coli TaxID=562 RepID=UPI00215AFB96